MGCTPGSQRHHTSVISRRLNLILCTRHKDKYSTISRGVVTIMNLFCYLARLAQWQSSRFVSGRLWVQAPHLAPPSVILFTGYGRHGSQRRSSLGYAEGNLSVKSVGGINSLNAFVLAQPPDAKQWQSSGTLPQNYSACTFGQVTAHPCRVQSRLYGSLNTQHPA